MVVNDKTGFLNEYKIVNRETLSTTTLRSFEKELTYKQVQELYKISNNTLLKICEKTGLKFRKAKKKVVVETIQEVTPTVSEINIDTIGEYDEITL